MFRGGSDISTRKSHWNVPGTPEGMNEAVSYLCTSSISAPVSVCIVRVDGLNRLRAYGLDNPTGSLCLSVKVELVSGGETIGLANSTPVVSAEADYVRWGMWQRFETPISSLLPCSELSLTLCNRLKKNGTRVARARIPLFDSNGLLLQGSHTCKLQPLNSTRRKFHSGLKKFVQDTKYGKGDTEKAIHIKGGGEESLLRVESAVRRFRHGLATVKQGGHAAPWLTRMTKARAKHVSSENQKMMDVKHPHPPRPLSLLVEFPAYSLPVLFHEEKSKPSLILPRPSPTNVKTGGADTKTDTRHAGSEAGEWTSWAGGDWLFDPAVDLWGGERGGGVIGVCYDKKALKVARGGNTEALLSAPGALERRQLKRIMKAPNPSKDRTLVWRYRRFLQKNKSALTAFVRCVDWDDTSESKEATALMAGWERLDAVDAIELLSGHFKGEARSPVRAYAVESLRREGILSDKRLISYLLTFTQALRNEERVPSPLSSWLCERAAGNFEVASLLCWYLKVETEDETDGKLYLQTRDLLYKTLLKTERGKEWYQRLRLQEGLVKDLANLADQAKKKGKRTQEWIQHMRSLIKDPDGAFTHLQSFPQPVHCPLRPQDTLVGVIPEETTMFKSAMAPLLVTFRLENGGKKRWIFKTGDDLRQDQLVVCLIELMDALFKRLNQDLQLTPYRILATSRNQGIVEYVENSATLSKIRQEPYTSGVSSENPEVQAEEKQVGGLLAFMRKYNKGTALDLAIDTFVRSCAGYCVITYLLGVGDRHLDNLLMTRSGHLFHIDFGFLFGDDPKGPFAPSVRVVPEMKAVIEWAQKDAEFRKLCCWTFNRLRSQSRSILSLVEIMKPMLEGESAKHCLTHVQNKLALHLSDSQAEGLILDEIKKSEQAFLPEVLEIIHVLATARR
ncbi:hypothetical protein AAMO2058_000960800 [Amorphochlora amoebiformis]